MTEKTDKVEVTVATTSKPKATKTNPLVEIVPNQDFKIMYGDKWYYFTKDEPLKVPAEIKMYLKEQGALAVL